MSDRPRQNRINRSEPAFKQTLAELETHRAELEIQNEELRTTQVELDIARDRYFDLFDLAPIGYVSIDHDGRIVEANLEAAALLGQERASLRGKRLSTMVAPTFSDSFHVFRKSVFRNLPRQTLNTVLIDSSGKPVPARLVALSSRELDARKRVTQIAVLDLTEISRAKVDLAGRTSELIKSREKERHMATVVENAGEGILSIDERGTVLSANRASASMLGCTENNLLGNSLVELVDNAPNISFRKWIVQLLNKPREVRFKRPEGEPLPAFVSVTPIPESRLYVVIIRDLTEHQRMQRLLREQEALVTIGRMASVVAHEVRNPLTGIAGVLQLLSHRFIEGSKEQSLIRESLDRIAALRETIKQMLLYARPRELKLQKAPIVELLRETADLFKTDVLGKNIVVTIPESSLVLSLDRDYMREALLNLFLNAAQAMGGKGEIHTEIEHGSRYCWLRVIDNGPGIPPQNMGRVFEPFFTTKPSGTGLGLPLVKSVVERHEGEISIFCPRSGGTIVTLKLPRH